MKLLILKGYVTSTVIVEESFYPNLGGVLGNSFCGIRDKTTLCLKLQKIMLETWELVGKYTQICGFRKYTF